MTDREMLELAAKAGEIKGKFIELRPEDGHPEYRCGIGSHKNVWRLWNSSMHYGEALELAVQLKIRMEPTENYAVAYAGSVCAEQFTERNGDNPVLAMCRAVTRAAAEIGRNMP